MTEIVIKSGSVSVMGDIADFHHATVAVAGVTVGVSRLLYCQFMLERYFGIVDDLPKCHRQRR